VASVRPAAANHSRVCSPVDSSFGLEVSETLPSARIRSQTVMAIITIQITGPQKSMKRRTVSMPRVSTTSWASQSPTKQIQPSAESPRYPLSAAESGVRPGSRARISTTIATDAR
jgi:hypothetical protein